MVGFRVQPPTAPPFIFASLAGPQCQAGSAPGCSRPSRWPCGTGLCPGPAAAARDGVASAQPAAAQQRALQERTSRGRPAPGAVRRPGALSLRKPRDGGPSPCPQAWKPAASSTSRRRPEVLRANSVRCQNPPERIQFPLSCGHETRRWDPRLRWQQPGAL